MHLVMETICLDEIPDRKVDLRAKECERIGDGTGQNFTRFSLVKNDFLIRIHCEALSVVFSLIRCKIESVGV